MLQLLNQTKSKCQISVESKRNPLNNDPGFIIDTVSPCRMPRIIVPEFSDNYKYDPCPCDQRFVMQV